MKIVRIVVISGFGARVAERVKLYLQSRQFKVVLATPRDNADVYFSNLLDNFHSTIKTVSGDRDVRMIALLASCVSTEEARKLEDTYFFPVVRRLEMSSVFRNDINRSSDLGQSIISVFKKDGFTELAYRLRKPADERILLPLKNTPSKKLFEELESIYRLDAAVFSRALDKEIVRVKKSGVWCVGSLSFRGAFNSEEHPVRRCSDTNWCDVAAKFRLGFEVSDRFEFDVTAEGGVSGKKFYLCDGTQQRVPAEAKHLNMRINDDFKW